MKKISNFLSKIKTQKITIFPSVFLANTITILIFPLLKQPLSSFSRIISTATANDYDVSKQIINFLILAVVFVLSFILSYYFFSYLRTKYSKGLVSFWGSFYEFSILAATTTSVILISAPQVREATGALSIFTATFYILLICFVMLLL